MSIRTSQRGAALTLTVTALVALAGCGRGEIPPDPRDSQQSTSDTLSARQLLAARAAQATDRSFTASYRMGGGDANPAPTASASVPTGSPSGAAIAPTPAADGSRLLMISRSAAGYRIDISEGQGIKSVVHNGQGTFRCTLSGVVPSCTKQASERAAIGADSALLDVFTSWPGKLADPSTAITVTAAEKPPVPGGGCFQVDGITASLDPPVDPGVYCFAKDGMLTGLKVSSATLTLTGSGPPPPTFDLPAPIVTAPPSPTPTPSGTGRPGPTGTPKPRDR